MLLAPTLACVGCDRLVLRMSQMFRRRSGTGTMYADNSARPAKNRRGKRRTRMQRGDNRDRAWAQEDDPNDPLLHPADMETLLAVAREAAESLMDLLREVGGWVVRSQRWRQPLPREIVQELGDLLDWYLILHTIGLVDRRGVWLGEPLVPDPPA